MLLRVNQSAALFSCCLSIQILCYVVYIAIFCSKIVLLSSHSVVSMSSHFLPLFTARMFFRSFGKYCFVCIVWSYIGMCLVFLLSPVPSDLFSRVVSFVLLCSFRLDIFLRFSPVLFSFVFEAFLFVHLVWFHSHTLDYSTSDLPRWEIKSQLSKSSVHVVNFYI